ncbi:hypothetical protein HPB48_013995 [Haemaphysalis longicornis]|uniref:Uncharacterized protein n=1 Tax=Haemaphysalis longicornis TaxID=44386 RepID=A0A9J6G5C9_HAELO|nr:hypothetical protein HPB48_013995 [Haemaphysalis longicornis]
MHPELNVERRQARGRALDKRFRTHCEPREIVYVDAADYYNGSSCPNVMAIAVVSSDGVTVTSASTPTKDPTQGPQGCEVADEEWTPCVEIEWLVEQQ